MLAGAYQQVKYNGTLTTFTSMGDLTPYMNYVSVDTTSAFNGCPLDAFFSVPVVMSA